METHLRTTSPAASELRYRRSLPDVPSDVGEDELMLHFNDPNWDYDVNSSTYFSSTPEPSVKAFSQSQKPPSYMGSTDVDTESHISSSWPEKVPDVEDDYSDDSPYPEVRAAVPNTDDPNMPASTVRAWIVGLFVVIIVSGYNSFIQFRMPQTLINALLIQIASYPMGKLLERILPAWRLTFLRYSISLNPGPFNIKEHALITMMGNVVINASNITDVVNVEFVFFNKPWPFANQILLSIAVQLIGFAAAGFFRQFLVWPAAMIWPGVLVRTALLSAMHKTWDLKEKKHIPRSRFFLFVMIGSFVYYWLPGYLFTALSFFNWACWIAPNNVTVNSLFGSVTGLGMGLLTFDWSQISFIASPMVVPWWAQINIFVAFVIMIWFMVPVMWSQNVLFSQFLPLSSTNYFDNTGLPYNASAILTDGIFDAAKYSQYSPLFMPLTTALTWGASFALYGAVLVHTYLWYRKDIARQFRSSLRDHRDVHSRLMSVYPEVPRLWYGVLGVIVFVLGIVGNEIAKTQLPVWAYIVGVILGLVFTLPLSILLAVTNQALALSVLAEMLAGYMIPGKPVANMVFKTLSYSVVWQAQTFAGDMKMGHYLKVPPIATFAAQIVSAIVGVFVSVGVQTWALYNISDLCSPDQPQFLTCPFTSVFEGSALIFGNIGPQRIFGRGAIYYPIVFFFVIGLVLPIPFYFLAKRYPRSFFRYVHIPLAFGTLVLVPPATGANFAGFIIVGAIFQWYMRRRHFRWWMRYNYLLSSGLDAGVILALVVIFFALQFPRGGIVLNWWGNTVWQNTADATGLPLKTLAPGEIFGPSI
ncbi:OPT oligopeptide transporter [Vararia minispora EC-137]|uniref:OPT oligopeptide transporter n=1 Tax=Vararia minispora EC-137 TaxID=1314806 RepID=A0ACB8QLC8_9AGAM|nr:OPT oligopeptide transporter [Vararia minispora EC-137]